MKVSLKWIAQFTDVVLPVDELVDKIGAQLGAVEEVVNLGERYQGIVIVKVMECKPLEGSDHLSVCQVDDGRKVKEVERGEDGLVQVVCGAANVREGLLVAWLPPGSTVPSSWDGEKFVLEARKLRGVVSNGMLASAKELALGDDHSGILEIDKEAKPGDDFAKLYKLDDYIIDIENKMFTHRPDCFGTLGVARELSGIVHEQFASPAWYALNPSFPGKEADLPLRVTNELPELVSRFSAITLADIKLAASPAWLRAALAKVGQKPINNVVDLTNFYMLVTGQPLHAYDYDKVRALTDGDVAEITVRSPKPGEKIKLLNGKEIEPRADAIMIASGQHLIGLGGVMGGFDTEVDENTKNIIIEAANFDMYNIRRTSMAHGLFTDAVTRFTKGQSPLQTLAVLAKITSDLQNMAGGKVAGDPVDDNHVEQSALERGNLFAPVTVSAAYINERLGLKLAGGEMKTLLENVEFKVDATGENLTVHAPFWRTDIELPEDVVEEVGRLYGYDKLPLVLPKRDLTPALKDALLEAKDAVRDTLSRAGANEVLTYSFVHGDLLKKVGQDTKEAFQLGNALSPDLQYYRLSLMPSLLMHVHPNIKAGYNEFALFELGRTHGAQNGKDEEGLPREFEFTALVVAAADKLKKPGSAFYQARKYLTQLAPEPLLEFRPLSDDLKAFAVTKPYDDNRSALVYLKGGEFLGIIGEFKPSVRKLLKLPAYSAGFELDTVVLMKLLAAGSVYTPLSKFPKVAQDISLAVDAKKTFAEVSAVVDESLAANAPPDTLVRLEVLDIYQNPEEPGKKHYSFRITITADNRTLTDKEVSAVLDTVAAAATDKIGAARL